MNAGAKLAAYSLVLAGMVGAGAALGAAVGPLDTGGGAHGEHDVVEPAERDTTTSTTMGSGFGSHGH